MITRAQTLREKLNEERAALARRDRRDLPPLRQVEHLWVVSGVSLGDSCWLGAN